MQNAFPYQKIPPQLSWATQTLPRFHPHYWRVEGPDTASFSLTNYRNGFEVLFKPRLSSDLIGIIWESEDHKDHQFLSYETLYDYSGVVWDFDIEVSTYMPMINNEQMALTLAVYYLENEIEQIAYIPLFNYADQPVSRQAHIQIDWDTVKAGFNATIPFPVNHIQRIVLNVVASSYNPATLPYPLPDPELCYVRITNSTVQGTNTQLELKQIIVSAHHKGICTSYDDHYDLNPQRIVDNIVALGYRGLLNHYCGMSRYPDMYWDTQVNRWQIPDTLATRVNVVNPCALKWHQVYAKALHEAAFAPVFSLSFEMYSLAANEYWAQRDIHDNLGKTAYEPPSYFFSPSNINAMAYLQKGFLEFAETMQIGGCQVNMQIGEPWWWYNPATNLPCIYDYSTRLAFNQDTGLYAPDLGDIFQSVYQTGTPYEEFRQWLRIKLGQTCQDIRTVLKKNYPDAQFCPLLFLPAIRTQQPTLLTSINYPQEYYRYPNFDYIIVEAYDWILENNLKQAHRTIMEVALDELAYPSDKTAYLAGFVPPENLTYLYGFNNKEPYHRAIWQRILGDMQNNETFGLMKQLIWAYPQVMAHSLTIDIKNAPDGFFLAEQYYSAINDNTPYPPEIYL